MKTRPKLNWAGIAERLDRSPQNLNRETFNRWVARLREERRLGTIGPGFEALETLRAMLLLLDSGAATPVVLAHEDTVPVPRALLDTMIAIWEEAKRDGNIETKLGLSARGMGKGALSELRRARLQDERLQTALLVEARILEGASEHAARQSVAKLPRQPEFDTVVTAHEDYRDFIRREARSANILE